MFVVTTELEEERKKRKRAEDVWHDAQREYRAPLVVPAMLDAFEKLARIAGDAIVTSSSSSSNSSRPPTPVVKVPVNGSSSTPAATHVYSGYDRAGYDRERHGSGERYERGRRYT